MKAIITLTVAGGKRLIARAIDRMPEVTRARENGRILLKGGTTVSAVSEELLRVPMRISGRMSPRGLGTADVECEEPHCILVEGNRWSKVDQEDPFALAGRLAHGDVAIVGANLIDASGGAALMAGAACGGFGGRLVPALTVEGIPLIVAAGLEKLIPGTVGQAIQAAGRRNGIDLSMGLAVGLVPVRGKIVTEVEAIKLLAPVDCVVIGRGGVDGSEGGVTLLLSGEEAHVRSMFRLALALRYATTSGSAQSLTHCVGPNPKCSTHVACVYRSPKLLAVVSRED